jgi:hypothetical protein
MKKYWLVKASLRVAAVLSCSLIAGSIRFIYSSGPNGWSGAIKNMATCTIQSKKGIPQCINKKMATCTNSKQNFLYQAKILTSCVPGTAQQYCSSIPADCVYQCFCTINAAGKCIFNRAKPYIAFTKKHITTAKPKG